MTDTPAAGTTARSGRSVLSARGSALAAQDGFERCWLTHLTGADALTALLSLLLPCAPERRTSSCAAGVCVVAVDPRHTSRTCPACGLIDQANRKTRARFRCVGCGLAGPADAIAAQNIRALGRAHVMVPHAPPLSRHPVPGADASCLL